MYPVLARLGPLTIYSYGVALVAAFLTVVRLARRAARARPQGPGALSADQVTDWASWTVIGGLLGGRLFYVLLHWDVFSSSMEEIPAIWHGGLVWYGGFLGGVLATLLYVRAKRLSLLRVLDQIMPVVALGHGIGRIGCFLNGCCFGLPTSAWYGVVFPGVGVPLIPTQLVEAVGLFGIAGLLWRVQRLPWLGRPGKIFGLYLVSYAVLRFGIEFLRGDQTVWWGGLTLQQVISLVVCLIGLGLLTLRFGSRLQAPGSRQGMVF